MRNFKSWLRRSKGLRKPLRAACHAVSASCVTYVRAGKKAIQTTQ